jgi:hypothetical protein
MERKYLAFDIETATIIPEDEPDWNSHRPLGIACAATMLADTDEMVLWHAGDRMSQQDAAALVYYLTTQVEQGYTILTWNGLGFDFDILAEESGLLAECKSLAASHIDMMFHILCRLGYGVKLDGAAKGMGLAGKTEGMSGAMAPVLWAEGKREEVLQYVAQDVRTTAQVATACEATGQFRWIARSGKLRSMALPEGWLTVDKAEQLPEPDTSWMADPWPRSKFTAWMRNEQANELRDYLKQSVEAGELSPSCALATYCDRIGLSRREIIAVAEKYTEINIWEGSCLEIDAAYESTDICELLDFLDGRGSERMPNGDVAVVLK